jgi:phage tail-like protein
VHRPFVLIRTVDQWRRCAHEHTSLDDIRGVVSLARTDEGAEDDDDEQLEFEPLPTLAGLAFDRRCRLLRADPERGQVFVHRWRARGESLALEPDEGTPLFAAAASGPLGELSSCPGHRAEFVSEVSMGPLQRPTGLAVGAADQLYVWEAEAGALTIFDLERERLRERLQLGYAGAVDLAWIDGQLWGVGPGLGLLERPADGRVRVRGLPSHLDGVASRIAGDSRGRAWVLLDAGTADARVMPLVAIAKLEPIAVPGASDIVFLPAELHANGEFERLVVARGLGHTFRQFTITVAPPNVSKAAPLAARGYDGRGIVLTPDQRVAFFGTRELLDGRLRAGVWHASPARARYHRRGRLVSFRLDAGEFHTRWGRIFIDACVPEGTSLRIAALTTDVMPDGEPIPHTKPVNDDEFELLLPGEPPLPVARLDLEVDEITAPLVERSNGREQPWVVEGGGEGSTWEAPVEAEPGRYLWLFVALHGNSRKTPSFRSIRVERRGHPLLERLPKVYSRDPLVATFLWRFLATFDGALLDLELRTALRHAIFDPRSSPASFLPWLAELLGLTLDERWPLAARRQVIVEAAELFRFRGTVPGLSRLLEIYLGFPIEIVEHFRVRGLGGAIVGAGEGELGEQTLSASVVGGGFRVGGAIGSDELVEIGSGVPTTELGADAFEAHAHRFTVVVPAVLGAEQREVIESILEQHRPAHTLYELCTLDAGMRVGIGLYVDLSTIVGAGAGFAQLQVGGGPIGRDRIVGRPRPGTTLGGARVGEDSRKG